MTPSSIWWWVSSAWTLDSMKYSFIAITPRFTLKLIKVSSMDQMVLFENYYLLDRNTVSYNCVKINDYRIIKCQLKKWNIENIVMDVIKHLEINQILALNSSFLLLFRLCIFGCQFFVKICPVKRNRSERKRFNSFYVYGRRNINPDKKTQDFNRFCLYLRPVSKIGDK